METHFMFGKKKGFGLGNEKNISSNLSDAKLDLILYSFDSLKSGIAIYDLESKKIVYSNKSLSDFIGFSKDEMKSINIDKIDFLESPFSKYEFRDYFKKLIIEKEPIIFLWKFKTKFGMIKYFDISTKILELHSRKYIFSEIIPIKKEGYYESSNYKDLIATPKSQEHFLESLMGTIPNAVFWKDLQSRFLGCNKKFADIVGMSPEDIVGKTDYFFLEKKIAESKIADDNKVITSGKSLTIEEEVKDSEGNIANYLTNKVPLLDENNNIIGIIGVLTDISNLKNAQEKVQNSESRFRNLFNNMSNGVSIFETGDDGVNFIFKDFNDAAEIIEGYSKHEVIGKNVLDLFPGVEDYGLLDVFRRVYKTGVPEFHPISYYKDQRIEGWRYNYVYRLPSMEIVSVYDDVTEQKESEEKLKSSIKEKDVLLKEVHHRVKNNLQIISSLFSLSTLKIEDEKSKKIFIESQNRIKSIALIHETIYGSRNLAQVDFQKYTTNLVNNLLISFGVSSTQINPIIDVAKADFDIDTAIPCGMIINELITNSLKHGFSYGDKGEIKVNLNVSSNFYILEVSDNGKGLPRDFDIYDTDSLGLQIVTTLVNQLSGVLEINGNEGAKYIIKFKRV